MPLPWVVSDFEDCEIVTASFPNSKRKANAGTKRPLSSLSQDFNEKAHISIKQVKPEVPWSIKYSPKSVADLVVAKAKVSELSDVLSNIAEPRIILLIGPPGCGKSVTVRCIANSLGYRIREWNQPSSETRAFLDFRGDISEHFDSGICRTFSDFVLNATAYESLAALSSSSSSSSSPVVTVIEEMPTFKSEFCPETMFHDLLRQCAASLRNPVCFILTSNAPSADPPEMQRLFPQRLREELGIYCLTLNPIPTRTMTKSLTTVASLEKVTQILPANCINSIVETCEGDLRSAVNSLQFLSQKAKYRQTEPSSVSKRAPKERRLAVTKTSTKLTSSPSKDANSFSLGHFLQSDSDAKSHDSHSLLLFRALGRVLYCKRTLPEDMSTDSKPRVSLPAHLKQFEADSLTFDPVALLRHSPIPPATFVGFLQHNAPAFYTTIDDLATLNDRYLSVCDLIFNQWDTSFENNDELAGLLAVFAVTNCNSPRRRFVEKEPNDTQTQKHGDSGYSFKPLHAPPVWNTLRCASERQKAARSLLPDYLVAVSDQVIADYISFARTTRYNNAGSRGWVRELGSLGEVGRIRSTTLSASASHYDEESASENQNFLRISAQEKDNKNSVMPNDDAAECRTYNDRFLQTIQEDDD